MIALTRFGVGLAVWLLRDTSRVSFHVPFFMLWPVDVSSVTTPDNV